MVRIVAEIREANGELHGTLLQEGRAASGGRAEVFAPGSVSWPADGVDILTEHRGASVLKAFPHRDTLGKIKIRATANTAVREAIEAGKKFMSVEFVSIEERTVKAGIREILRAHVPSAALVENPEYDTSSAEVRAAQSTAKPRLETLWL